MAGMHLTTAGATVLALAEPWLHHPGLSPAIVVAAVLSGAFTVTIGILTAALARPLTVYTRPLTLFGSSPQPPRGQDGQAAVPCLPRRWPHNGARR